MQWRVFSLAPTVAMLVVVSAAAQSRDENWMRCKDSDNPDLKIEACSAIIQSREETTENISIALNSRGNAYSDKGQYERAIQDYDEAMQLNPNYATAVHNRGIARFALGQFADASADFGQKLTLDAKNAVDLTWLKLDAGHAYSVIWLHLARGKMGAGDEAELKGNAAWVDYNKWPGPVVALYLGQMTPEQVRMAAAQGDARVQKDQGCEAAFYTGEYELLRKNSDGAKKLIQEAVDTCPHGFVEYTGAVTELRRLGG